MRISPLAFLLALCALMLLGTSVWARGDKNGFFLHDGDRVVFYGDSITEQQMYGRDIETFVETRYPRLHISYLNSGWSGDTAAGGGGGPIDVRLNRDVLPYKPTVVTILLGMNDGRYSSFDPATYQTYMQGMTHIVDVLTEKLPGVRLVLLTPTFFDYAAKERQPPPPGQGYSYGSPAPDYNQVLLKYSAFLQQLGAQRHIPVVDMNAPMQAATEVGRRADPKFALSGDGVHPNEVGHLIMAATVLTAWNATPFPISFSLSERSQGETPLIPWPIPDDARPAMALSPLVQRLSVYAVKAPGAGHLGMLYAIHEDGKDIAAITGDALRMDDIRAAPYASLSVNLRAQQVLSLANQRINTWHDFFKGSSGIAHANDVPTVAEITSLTTENDALNVLRTQEYQAAQPTRDTYQLLPANVAHG
jgi:lysophospholipase L1-like esterase